MKVGLFIPCYIDQFYPQVGIATLTLLERLGIEVEYPMDQTCCGQPMANSGSFKDAEKAAKNHLEIFRKYDTVVCPSGSCVCFVREQYGLLVDQEGADTLRQNTYELCEFLTDIVKVDDMEISFPYKVGLHNSCHATRGLRLSKSSELIGKPYSKVRDLLSMVKDLQLVELEKEDECCGFGGTFSVNEEAVSCKMGIDRVLDHEKAGAEVITSVDMSCLMQMEGLIRRQQKPMRVHHIAEILAGTTQ